MPLARLDLPPVFRAAVELATDVVAFPHPERPLTEVDYSPERQAQHAALDRIESSARRLKIALGASGPEQVDFALGPPHLTSWKHFLNDFEDLDHEAAARGGLTRLALAACHLSGYATVRQIPHDLRDRGMELLADGLAQMWAGLMRGEKRQLEQALGRARSAFGWTNKPTNQPHPFRGSDGFRWKNQVGNSLDMNGFYTRDRQTQLEYFHAVLVSRVAHPKVAPRPPLPPTVIGGQANLPADRPKNDTKGKDIDAKMLKVMAENYESLDWSARKWARELRCASSTVQETTTWTERLVAARAMRKADAASKMDRSKKNSPGRRAKKPK